MNWQQALNDYQLYLKIERGLSANSIENYSRDVKKLIGFLEDTEVKELPLSISEEVIQQFIYEIAKSMNARSQSRIISGLRSFFDYLIFEDYRKDNPTQLIETPKIGRKLPDTLSEKEINSIITAIDLSSIHGQRNKTLLETLYSCGLRVTEVITLQLSDLFFDEGFIRVLGKGDKQRFVPINLYTQKLILIYMNQVRNHIQPKKGFEDTLFLNQRGQQLTRNMVFLIVKDATEKAGIRKNVSPHTFRHSFATHLLKRGADLRSIQQMLGHESITTTEVYMHVDKTFLKEVVEKYHPRK
ncbi:MAG: site-specific tyrosine recombinase XerD [Flavobacteriaceae bacterium]|nr:site-specific tyrosine recombinase XerD [Flavobacteriaceae bacterium]